LFVKHHNPVRKRRLVIPIVPHSYSLFYDKGVKKLYKSIIPH